MEKAIIESSQENPFQFGEKIFSENRDVRLSVPQFSEEVSVISDEQQSISSSLPTSRDVVDIDNCDDLDSDYVSRDGGDYSGGAKAGKRQGGRCAAEKNCKIFLLDRRMKELMSTVAKLSKEIKREKELWRKEVDLLSRMQIEVLEYNYFTKYDSDEFHPQATKRTGSESMIIQEYEKKIATYEAALAAAHAERRMTMRRQIAAYTYQKKLMEVEKMCSVELERVTQAASMLQPLNRIASEWNITAAKSCCHHQTSCCALNIETKSMTATTSYNCFEPGIRSLFRVKDVGDWNLSCRSVTTIPDIAGDVFRDSYLSDSLSKTDFRKPPDVWSVNEYSCAVNF